MTQKTKARLQFHAIHATVTILIVGVWLWAAFAGARAGGILIITGAFVAVFVNWCYNLTGMTGQMDRLY